METAIVTLSSGRTAELRELSARQQMNSDIAGKGDATRILYFRIASALTKLGDQAFDAPKNDLEIEARIDMLSGREIDELAQAYTKQFGAKGDALKNA